MLGKLVLMSAASAVAAAGSLRGSDRCWERYGFVPGDCSYDDHGSWYMWVCTTRHGAPIDTQFCASNDCTGCSYAGEGGRLLSQLQVGHVWSRVSQTCTRPAEASVQVSEQFAGTYVLACVTWDPTAYVKLEAANSLTDSDLATLCSSVGGVCGWSCDSSIPSEHLAGCTSDSTIEVTPTSIAGTEISGANFAGSIEMEACLDRSSDGKCDTDTEKFKQWKCHNCMYDPTATSDDQRRLQAIPGLAGPDEIPRLTGADAAPDVTAEWPPSSPGVPGNATIYTSLPRFQVTLSNVTSPAGVNVFSSPYSFILTSSVSTKGQWTKLYMTTQGQVAAPVPLDSHGKPIAVGDDDEDSRPVEDNGLSLHVMMPSW